MEEVGIPIDTNRMSAAGVYLHADIEIAKKKLYDFPELHALEKDQGRYLILTQYNNYENYCLTM